MGSGNAGQESTDYSGNSVREEVFPGGPASSGSSVKEGPPPSGTATKRTRSTSTSSKSTDQTLDQNQQSNEYGRTCVAVVKPTQVDAKASMVHHINIENKQNTQGKVFTKLAGNARAKKNGMWRVLHCVKGSPDLVDDNKVLSVSYSPTIQTQQDNFKMSQEMFGMMPVCRANSIRSLASSSNDVSNSSLRDVERGALEDELTAYMEELRQREAC